MWINLFTLTASHSCITVVSVILWMFYCCLCSFLEHPVTVIEMCPPLPYISDVYDFDRISVSKRTQVDLRISGKVEQKVFSKLS